MNNLQEGVADIFRMAKHKGNNAGKKPNEVGTMRDGGVPPWGSVRSRADYLASSMRNNVINIASKLTQQMRSRTLNLISCVWLMGASEVVNASTSL